MHPGRRTARGTPGLPAGDADDTVRSQVWSHTEVTAANGGPSLAWACVASVWRVTQPSFVARCRSPLLRWLLVFPRTGTGGLPGETRAGADHRRQSSGARGA